jgi:hypothetical protein
MVDRYQKQRILSVSPPAMRETLRHQQPEQGRT